MGYLFAEMRRGRFQHFIKVWTIVWNYIFGWDGERQISAFYIILNNCFGLSFGWDGEGQISTFYISLNKCLGLPFWLWWGGAGLSILYKFEQLFCVNFLTEMGRCIFQHSIQAWTIVCGCLFELDGEGHISELYIRWADFSIQNRLEPLFLVSFLAKMGSARFQHSL